MEQISSTTRELGVTIEHSSIWGLWPWMLRAGAGNDLRVAYFTAFLR